MSRSLFSVLLVSLAWLSLLLCAASGLHAQTFNLQTGREPVACLDGLWRFHPGDNPVWSDPNFDDSQWPLLLFPAPSSPRKVHFSQPTFARPQGDPCCINLRRTPSR